MSNTIQRQLNSDQLLQVLALSKHATAVYTTDDLIIEAANDAMIAFWGKDRQIIGLPLEEAVPEFKGQPFKHMLQQVLKTGITDAGVIPAETMINGRLQTAYYEYEYRAVKDDAGRPYCILHTAADVTERILNRQAIVEAEHREHLLNEELATTNEELAAANEELIAGNEALAEINEELTFTNEELHESEHKLLLAYDELARSQDELLFAIDAAGLGTWDLDPKTNRFKGNDLLKSWFGLEPHEEISLSIATDNIITDDRENVISAINRALQYESGGNYDIEYTIQNPHSGVLKVVRAKGKALFDNQQKAIQFSGILQDITEQKQDEQRKNDFIGIVSHELKTPLTSLSAYIQLLHAKAQKSEDTFTTGALSKVNNQVKKMSILINGFLNVSRLESGKIHLVKENFELNELVKEVIEDTIQTTASHDIQLLTNTPVSLYADKEKIGSVISNLLSNAIKYSPRGKRVEVSYERKAEAVQVSIKDEGMGIKAEDREKLFDRFYRVESKHTQNISGFGIGLYLCAEIVQRHNGTIGVDSQLGVGSTFWFTVPLSK